MNIINIGDVDMKKIKLLFQGDSITDAGRDYNDCHNLGLGYPKYAAMYLKEKYPDVEFEFIDLDENILIWCSLCCLR